MFRVPGSCDWERPESRGSCTKEGPEAMERLTPVRGSLVEDCNICEVEAVSGLRSCNGAERRSPPESSVTGTPSPAVESRLAHEAMGAGAG